MYWFQRREGFGIGLWVSGSTTLWKGKKIKSREGNARDTQAVSVDVQDHRPVFDLLVPCFFSLVFGVKIASVQKCMGPLHHSAPAYVLFFVFYSLLSKYEHFKRRKLYFIYFPIVLNYLTQQCLIQIYGKMNLMRANCLEAWRVWGRKS